MTFAYNDTVNAARLNTIEAAVGALPPILRIYQGTVPAISAVTTGTSGATATLVEMTNLPSDWLTVASGVAPNVLLTKTAGTWSGLGTSAAGAGQNATFFRILPAGAAATAAGAIQGSITATGGGGDMTLDNISIAQNQTVTVNTFQIKTGNQVSP